MRKVTVFRLLFNKAAMIFAASLKLLVTFNGIYGILSKKEGDMYAR